MTDYTCGRQILFSVVMASIYTAASGSAIAQVSIQVPGISFPTRIVLREASTARFGDSQADVHVDLQKPPGGLRLAWRHAAENRTLSAGESTVDASGHATFVLRIPPVNAGVVLGSRLTLALVDNDQKPLVENTHELWIFPRDPFALRTKWLKELNLSLYDPEGQTAKALGELKVPFKKLLSLGALDETSTGIILVGEGVNLDKLSTLGSSLRAAAARGVPVLCLSPARGELPDLLTPQPVPASGLAGASPAPIISPSAVRFERERIVTELDKRLSAAAWTADGGAVRRLMPVAGRNELLLRVTADPAAWPWIEATYPGENRLILCGFPIVKTWNEDPTGRYLFARILEKLELPKKPAAE